MLVTDGRALARRSKAQTNVRRKALASVIEMITQGLVLMQAHFTLISSHVYQGIKIEKILSNAGALLNGVWLTMLFFHVGLASIIFGMLGKYDHGRVTGMGGSSTHFKK